MINYDEQNLDIETFRLMMRALKKQNSLIRKNLLNLEADKEKIHKFNEEHMELKREYWETERDIKENKKKLKELETNLKEFQKIKNLDRYLIVRNNKTQGQLKKEMRKMLKVQRRNSEIFQYFIRCINWYTTQFKVETTEQRTTIEEFKVEYLKNAQYLNDQDLVYNQYMYQNFDNKVVNQ